MQNFNNLINENSDSPISPSKEFLDELTEFTEIKNVEKIISKFGIVRTRKVNALKINYTTRICDVSLNKQ